MTLILHCGGELATYEDVCAVQTPAPTSTFHPISHRDLIDELRARIVHEFPASDLDLKLGLARDGAQLFATFGLKLDEQDMGLSIGLRNAHDKSFSLGLVSGAHVFVCDNMAFNAASTMIMRKHTQNAWRDVRHAIAECALQADGSYQVVRDELNGWKQLGVGQDRGYELLGLAMGRGVLTSSQANIAFSDWDTPRHAEFEDRTAYSLYNCVTEGLKVGVMGKALDRHVNTHGFFREQLGAIDASYAVVS